MSGSKKAALFILIISLVCLISLETLSRLSLSETFKWIINNPFEMMVNYIYIIFFNLLLYAFFNNIKVIYLFFGLLLWLLGLISGLKLELLGLPLLPNDIVLINEAFGVSKYLEQILVPNNIIIFIATLLVMMFVYLVMPNGEAVNKKYRLVISTLIIVISCVCIIGSEKLLYASGIKDLTWDQNENVKKNGFLVAFSASFYDLKVSTPNDYSEQGMKEVVKRYSASDQQEENSSIPTNIILLLSESLWDMTEVEGLELSGDPMEFYHHLTDKYTSGKMISPQFGGKTVNVEFEVLTGNSMKFLNAGTTPFLQQMNYEIDSIASIMNRNGYYSTAFNSYLNWFYNVKNAYHNLGFNQFISYEFLNPFHSGYYLSDQVLMEAIIKQTEATNGPDFVYAKTMETHFPYGNDKYETKEIKVLNADLSEESKNILETYIQGVYNFDKALEFLINYYDESDERTIVVVFGDHLPVLGNSHSVYKDLKYIEDNEESSNSLQLYQTPILVWDNYSQTLFKQDLNINATFVSPYLLQYAGIKGTPYMNYLWELYNDKEVPPINSIKDLQDYEERFALYKLFQYDALFGERYMYSLENIENNIKSSSYILGWRTPTILSEQLFVNFEIGSSLIIEGDGFVSNSIVVMDGVELKTSFYNERKLAAEVPNKLVNNKKSHRYQVMTKDSKGSVISKSDVYHSEVSN